MTDKGAEDLFVFGSLFFFVIFLGLTWDTPKRLAKRAPEVAGRVNLGRMVWHKADSNPSRGHRAFGWTIFSIALIVVIITGAGMVQTYMERYWVLTVSRFKDNYNLRFWIFSALFGVASLYGVWLFVIDFFRLGRECRFPQRRCTRPPDRTGDGRPRGSPLAPPSFPPDAPHGGCSLPPFGYHPFMICRMVPLFSMRARGVGPSR